MYKIVLEIPERWGGYFSGQKKEIAGRKGAYVKFPPWWGYGYFLELHIVSFHLWADISLRASLLFMVLNFRFQQTITVA